MSSQFGEERALAATQPPSSAVSFSAPTAPAAAPKSDTLNESLLAELERLRAVNLEKDAVIADKYKRLRSVNSEKDAVIANKEAVIAQKEAVIAKKNADLLELVTRRDEELEALRVEIEIARKNRDRLRELTASKSHTVRELIKGRALSSIPLSPQLGEITIKDDEPSASMSRKCPTAASEWWMPFANHNARHWTDVEFVAHLQKADQLKVEDVKLLDMILDAYPDERTAKKLDGTIATEMFGSLFVQEKNQIERLLFKTFWDVLEVTMGGLEPAQKHLKTEVLPGKSTLVKVDPQYASLFEPDDTITAVVKGPKPINELLGDVLGKELYDTSGLGNVTVEVKVPINCPYPMYDDPVKHKVDNEVICGHLVDYAQTFRFAEKYNPLRQLATYLILLRMMFGVVTTLNHTTFVLLELVDTAAQGAPENADLATLGWRVAATKKFDVCATQPLEGQTWSLFEIWVRFILASIGTSRLDKVPDGVKARFKKVAIDKTKRQRKSEGEAASSTLPAGASTTMMKKEKNPGGGNTDDALEKFTLSYADLFDEARFADVSEGVPAAVEFCPSRLPGDAEVISVGRMDRVFRKRVRGVDAVVKVLVLSDKPEELEGDTDEYPYMIVEELRREEKAYSKLDSLQGQLVPNFLGLGSAFGDGVYLFATEYAGTPLHEPVLRTVKAQMEVALRAVHALGVSHGNVAAKNFLLNGSGKVVVLNFGLCLFKDEVSEEEWQGQVAADLAALAEVEVAMMLDESVLLT